MYRQKHTLCPIYDVHLCIIVSDSVKEINERHDLELEGPLFAHTVKHGIQVPGEKGLSTCIFLIFNPKYKFDHRKMTYGCIAHECLHATSFMFMIIGAKPDIYNDEHQAYLMDYFYTQVIEFIKPYWKDGKSK